MISNLPRSFSSPIFQNIYTIKRCAYAALPVTSFTGPIHVLGAGSIGLLWAAAMRQSFPEYPVSTLLRPHYKDKLGGADYAEVLLKEEWHDKNLTVSVPIEYLDDDNKSEAAAISTLVIATKGQQARSALESVLPRVSDDLTIVVLCNGALDVRDSLLDVFQNNQKTVDPEKFILCVTNHGVHHIFNQESKDAPRFELTHIGPGYVLLGPGRPDIAQFWTDCGLDARIEANILPFLWQKLAVNCLFNPTTTLWQLTNAKCAKRPEYAALREGVVSEISTVAQRLHPDHASALSYESLDAFVSHVLPRAMHYSSMYQDVRVRRQTDSEIDCLNGYVVRKGKELNISTPVNEDLANQIRALTNSNIM